MFCNLYFAKRERAEIIMHPTLKKTKINYMKIEQLYTGCLSQGAYYILNGGEAVVIDPLR